MLGGSRREGFPRRRRITKRREYLRLQTSGARFSSPHYLVFASRRSVDDNLSGPRFGITVSRKVGDAVTRNRVKRWVRETCRRLADDFPPDVDLVVVARPSAAQAGLALTARELATLAERLRRR